MLYGIRLLYRNSTTRKNTILPYIQKQLLRSLMSITIIRSLYTRVTANRSIIIAIILSIYAATIIQWIRKDKYIIRQQGSSSYILILIMSYIASQIEIIIIGSWVLISVMVVHLIIGVITSYYRKSDHPAYTDTIYPYITYLSYISIIALTHQRLPFTIAAIITTIIIWYILISLPTHHIDITPDNRLITAQDILEWQQVLTGSKKQKYTIQQRLYIIGVQPSHGTLLIRIIIGTIIAAIIYQIDLRYSTISLSLVESMWFIILITISIIICILYYLSHRQQKQTISLRKITIIILTNIAIGISVVHLFHTDTWMMVIASMIRNTTNSIAIWWIHHSRYSDTLLKHEYYYRTITNTIIAIINTIFVLVHMKTHGRQTTLIILCAYRWIQWLLLYRIYNIYPSNHPHSIEKIYH